MHAHACHAMLMAKLPVEIIHFFRSGTSGAAMTLTLPRNVRSCVKIRIGDEGDKQSYMEASTRVCHRTRDPYWGQR